MLNGPEIEPEPEPEPDPDPEPEPAPEPDPEPEPDPDPEPELLPLKAGQSEYLELHELLPQPAKMAEPNMIATQRTFITGFISICLAPPDVAVRWCDSLRASHSLHAG
jgi:hypothetical protein